MAPINISLRVELNCFVLGDDPQSGFIVEIEKTKNVSDLKDLIKEKKANFLKAVDTSHFELCRVSLIYYGDVNARLKNANLEPLDPLLLLSQMFPCVESGLDPSHIHIVVRVGVPREYYNHFRCEAAPLTY